jgi:hypothetical protein
MKPQKHHLSFRLLATSLLLCGTVWAAQPVTLTNAGFESPVVAGDGGSGGVPTAWTVFNSGAVITLNPSSSGDLTAEAPEGANVALVTSNAQENGLLQILSSPFQADATYVLTAKVANTKFTGGFPGYRVQLLANGTVLAEDDNSQAVAEDSVVTSSVNYAYNAGLHAGLVGQPLEIRLLSKGLATSEEVAFDDIQLTVTLANPVANAGGPYSVPLGGTLSLNGSASQPSDGQTITTYEWDLDNNGNFDELITGATPASIPYATLTAAPPAGFGMVIGANTIKLKVTDSAAKTATVAGVVNLITGPTFTTSANVVSSDTWNQGGNWNLGAPPSGVQSGTIANGLTATVNTATVTPTYSGGLTLESNSVLDMRNVTNALNALGSGAITLNSSSTLRIRTGANVVVANNIALAGNATLTNSDNTTDNRTRTLDGFLSGPGRLDYSMRRGNTLTLTKSNSSWSGGFAASCSDIITSNLPQGVTATANDAFGTGDVTLNDAVRLVISAGLTDTIDDSADLRLNGRGRDGDKLVINSNETIDEFYIDGFPAPAGTYGKTGTAATYKYAWIEGVGILTVSNGSNPATTATFDAAGLGGSTTSVYEDEHVTITVTLSEPTTPALTAADFENSTGTAMTIESVTDVTPATSLLPGVVYKIVVKPTEVGSLNLRIKAGTTLNDVFGNAVTLPQSDNNTLNVIAWPALACPIGVWKPWANGGINPVTGNPWAVGDTYHVAFVTSGTRDATDPDIATYHTFVSNAATAAGVAGGTWYCIGQSYNQPTRNTNAPPMNTTNGIFLFNGAKLADDGADLSNGPDVFFNITETGGEWNGNVATGSTRKFGDPGQTNIEHGNSNRTDAAWWQVFNGAKTAQWHFYAISAPLTLQAAGTGGTFADWIATYPGVGGLTGVGDDADGDGIDNGVENFFGTNPSISNSGLVAGAVGVNTFTFTHPQNATPASDLTAAYQWSKDLATFNAGGVTDGDNTKVDFTTQLDTPVAGTTTVTATVSGTATSKLFVNIKVTQN